MKKKSVPNSLISIILTLLMVVGIGSAEVFAGDYLFEYHYANDNMSQIYIAGFSGDVPDDGYVVIPDSIDGLTVVGIVANAFANLTELSGVVVPYTATYIDAAAFANSGNVAVLYPDEYEQYKNSISDDNWHENTSQDYIISGTKLIGYKGNDSTITIPDGCTEIADSVFKNKKNITTVYIHRNIKSIGESAFENCKNLQTVILDKGMGNIEIGADAFKKTPWLADFDNSFVVLGTTLVKYKGDEKTVSIPNVLTAVADGAFFETAVETVNVPVTTELFCGSDCFAVDSDKSPRIYVYKDSAAQTYCKENEIKYVLAALPGDVDNNGDINTSDARTVLRAASNLEAEYFVNEIKDVADVSGDNKLTPADARLILRIAVGISEYSVDDILRMPRTPYEVMFAASNAVGYANAYKCGYSKFGYQEITATDMNTRTAKNLSMFEDELTSSDDAISFSYKQNTAEAMENFFDITFINADNIDTCTSVIDDEYYVFTITLKDELAQVDADSYTQQMFPVDSAKHFADKLAKKSWADKFIWDMTYSDCTLEMKVAIDTGIISYAYLTMNYDFAMSGKTGNTTVTNADGTGSVATATRTDVLRFTNFSYYGWN